MATLPRFNEDGPRDARSRILSPFSLTVARFGGLGSHSRPFSAAMRHSSTKIASVSLTSAPILTFLTGLARRSSRASSSRTGPGPNRRSRRPARHQWQSLPPLRPLPLPARPARHPHPQPSPHPQPRPPSTPVTSTPPRRRASGTRSSKTFRPLWCARSLADACWGLRGNDSEEVPRSPRGRGAT